MTGTPPILETSVHGVLRYRYGGLLPHANDLRRCHLQVAQWPKLALFQGGESLFTLSRDCAYHQMCLVSVTAARW